MRIGKFFLIPLLIAAATTLSSAQLARQWVARYSGNAKNGNNAATAMALDDSGNVYVTGWVSRTGTGVDIATIKYSPDGLQMWVSYYPPSGTGTDKPTAITVDTAHNVYVTGTTTTGTSNTDYVTLKINITGDSVKWAKTYNGPGNGEDHPTSIAVNDSLEVFVSGYSLGSGTNFDYATIKYMPNGDTAWVRRFNGAANGVDSALAMALRGFTDLYVTGTSVDSGYDYLTVKYNPATGDTVWTNRYNGYVLGNDIARAIVLRSSTQVYVTGSSQGINGDDDYLTIRLDATTGDTVWTSRYDGAAHKQDEAYALALNGSSTVFVTGKSVESGSFNDLTTIRINQTNGGGLKVDSYNGPGNDEDVGISILGGNKPHVIGPSAGAGTGYDYTLIELSATDNENFVLRYDGPTHVDDVPADIASPSANVFYVTGRSDKAKGSEFLTIKYVVPATIKYRTFVQSDYTAASVNLKSPVSIPTTGNVRDEAMSKAYPKIKKGFIGFPGGLVVGNARPDSASSFGWMRFTGGAGVTSMLPDTGAARGFDFFGNTKFVGERKNPKKEKYNNHLVGELLTLRINIGASDAEILPPTLGDLTYDDGDTSNHYRGNTLRQIAALADNYLTYWQRYPSVDWVHLDTIFTRVNRAFTGPFAYVSKYPLFLTGVNPVDSVSFLGPANAPLMNPLAFQPGSIEEVPDRYVLYQNYPNPFNPTTTISFSIPEDAFVTLKIYNMLGQEVATLLDHQAVLSGPEEIEFNANAIASGVYFYRIVAESAGEDGVSTAFTQVKKMLLIR